MLIANEKRENELKRTSDEEKERREEFRVLMEKMTAERERELLSAQTKEEGWNKIEGERRAVEQEVSGCAVAQGPILI